MNSHSAITSVSDVAEGEDADFHTSDGDGRPGGCLPQTGTLIRYNA
jgi:hypothetical protein